MRRIILAGVCLTALCGPASAQGLLVNDPASILTEAKQLAQEAKAYGIIDEVVTVADRVIPETSQPKVTS